MFFVFFYNTLHINLSSLVDSYDILCLPDNNILNDHHRKRSIKLERFSKKRTKDNKSLNSLKNNVKLLYK